MSAFFAQRILLPANFVYSAAAGALAEDFFELCVRVVRLSVVQYYLLYTYYTQHLFLSLSTHRLQFLLPSAA
jgi:hypothetical protein